MADYRLLMSSGLYADATAKGLLIDHKEIPSASAREQGEAVLLPAQVPIISYPYEWCFSQLKAAALLVLDLQELALSHQMSLKDATAYNVQFLGGRPVFIDTSSFEKYRNGTVWVAYRQYCEHFLTPLLLMSRVDVRLGRIQRTFIDGIPVDLAASMVSAKTWLNPWLYMHVRLHGKAQGRQVGTEPRKSSAGAPGKPAGMPLNSLLGLLKSLRQAVESLKWTEKASQWSDYSSASSYEAAASKHKHELVAGYLRSLESEPAVVWDLGANAGEFSRIFSLAGIPTIAWDADPAAVEHNYVQAVAEGDSSLLPLVQDFANPSPGLGWANEERMSFLQRGGADLVLALALIHHLVVGNSVPLGKAASFFAAVGDTLIIEFVSPEDPRVEQLLATRTDSHPYTEALFEAAFGEQFEIVRRDPILDSHRILYLMRRKRR